MRSERKYRQNVLTTGNTGTFRMPQSIVSCRM
jgi:hypothetical protein